MEEPVKDRLATTDEFGDRVYIYVAEVKGFFRKHRNWTQAILILFFLIMPWIKINGEQGILLSLPERKFSFFGLVFYAHDGPLIFFILAISAIGLALVTAIWGRVWCGWACPQTVFIDGVFRRIEYWIEGHHIQRRQLDEAPFSSQKFFKKLFKWILFFIIATIIAHSFIAYFVGAENLVKMISHTPSENWVDFLIVSGISLILLFDFGWFREQFCFIVCPYGRFQSVLLDNNSMNVMYDEKRGEPRKGSLKKIKPLELGIPNQTLNQNSEQEKEGDCVNCKRCIMVCPTGIDIRRGLQMECIHCTACIDACDEIMEKVKKPKGLIRYSSTAEMQGEKRIIWNFRTILYSFLILGAFSILTYKITTREDLHWVMLREKTTPYRILDGQESGFIINQFKAHIRNQTHSEMKIHFHLKDDAVLNQSAKLIQQATEIILKPGESQTHLLFIKFNKEMTKGTGQNPIPVEADYELDGKQFKHEQTAKLLGPLS